LPHLVGKTPGGEAAGDTEALCMVADGNVLVAERPGCLCHLLDGMSALAPGGVDMEVAPDHVVTDEIGEGSGSGSLKLAPVLPEFRLDPGETEGAVDPGLVLSRDRPAGRKVDEPVLVQPPVPRDREFAHDDVVLFRAREVLEGGSE